MGQSSVQSGLVKFEVCVKYPNVLWAAGFPSLQLVGWRQLCKLFIDSDRSQEEEEIEGEEA